LVLLLLLPLVAEYRASPSPIYPQLGYDPRHTGLSPWSGPQTSNLYWSVLVSQTNYGIWGKAVDSNGVIYAGSDDGNFYAINPNGTVKWTITGILVSGSFPSVPAIGPDGTIYVGSSGSNYLYAINPNGTIKWKFPVQLYSDSTYYFPAVTVDSNGTVYVGGTDKYLYAINPDGTLKWKYQAGSSGMFAAVDPSTGTVYFTAHDYYVYAFSQSGSLKWRYLLSGTPSNPVVGPDGTVYVGDANGYFYAIKPDGTLKWRYGQVQYTASGATLTAILQNPAVGPDGTVYVVADCGWLLAIKPDGTLKWKYAIDGAPYAMLFINGITPTVGKDGIVYIADYSNGYVHAVYPDGTLKWKWLDPNGYPISNVVITNVGLLLVSDDSGYLYVLGVPNLLSPSVTVSVNKAVAKPNDVIRVYGTASSPNGPIASVVVSAKSAYGRTSASCTASVVGVNWSCTLTIPPSPDAGTYTVYATARDSWGVSSVAKANFTVLGVPWPTQNGYYHSALSPFVGPKNPKVAWVFKTGSKFSFGNRSITIEADYVDKFYFPEYVFYLDMKAGNIYLQGATSGNTYYFDPFSMYKTTFNFACKTDILNPTSLKREGGVFLTGWSLFNSNGEIIHLHATDEYYLNSLLNIYEGWYSIFYINKPDGTLVNHTGYIPGDVISWVVTPYAIYAEVINTGITKIAEKKTLFGVISYYTDMNPNATEYSVYLVSFDKLSGKEVWNVSLGKLNRAKLSFPSNKGVFFGSFDNKWYPWLAVSPAGNLYAISNDTIYVVSPSGSVLQTIRLSSPALPIYIQAVSPAGNVYVQENAHKCDVIKPDGSLFSMNRDCPLLVDENGNMYYNNASYDASGNLRWTNDLFWSEDYRPFRLVVSPLYFLENGDYSFNFLVGVAQSESEGKAIIYVLAKNGSVVGSVPLALIDPDANLTRPLWALLSPDGNSLYIAYIDSYGYSRVVKVPVDDPLRVLIRNGDLAMPSPAVDFDGTVYIGYYDGNLYAVGPDGKLKWSFHTNDWIVSAPTIGPDGTIYVGSLDGYIYAINPDGTLKWKYNTGGWITASPEVSSNGTVFVGSWGSNNANGYLYILSPTGTLKAKYTLMGRPSSLLLDESLSTLYVSTWDGVIYAVNYTQQKYTNLRGYEPFSTLILSPSSTSSSRDLYASGLLAALPSAGFYQLQVGDSPRLRLSGASMYIKPSGRAFVAVDKDGNIIATYRQITGYLYSPALNAKVKLPAPPLAPPSTDADGNIYVGDSQGNLYSFGKSVRFNPETGYNELTPRWSIKLDGSIIAPPVVTYDGMYVVALDELAVYKIVNSTIAPTPVPKISVALAPNYSLWVILLVAMCVAGFAFASRGKIVLGISFITGAIAVYYVVLRPFVSLQTLITQAQQLLSNALAQIPLGPILPLIIAVAGIAVLIKVMKR